MQGSAGLNLAQWSPLNIFYTTVNLITGSQAPQVEVSPKTIAEAVNANITFYCNVQGQGPFNVRWIRGDGRPLSARTRIGPDNSLSIRSAQSTDAGSYMCTATNLYGRGNDEAKLVIVGECLLST